MKKATRVVASVFGVYAGLVGAAHGYFETLRGDLAPGGLMINAIGLPCQREADWHGCLPAMTIIPSFRATGVLAILFSLIVLGWAAGFIQRKRGGWILILQCILMLLVGGGFIPTAHWDHRGRGWDEDRLTANLLANPSLRWCPEFVGKVLAVDFDRIRGMVSRRMDPGVSLQSSHDKPELHSGVLLVSWTAWVDGHDWIGV